jgi:hypothetical protein
VVGCEMWMCVCDVLLAFHVKAGGSALILLNHGMVPVSVMKSTGKETKKHSIFA